MEHIQPKKDSVTVTDVAREAGVAKATAARVLGGYGIVSDRIRTKVLAAAEKLDYRPNELARSMTTGRSGTIGVIVGDIENPFFSSAVRGITDAARASGFTVILMNSSEDVEAEKSAIKTLMAKRVDGLIVTPAQASEYLHLEEVRRTGRPIVLLDRAVPELNVDSVTTDDRDAACAATRLLIDNGHRALAFVTACDTPDHRFQSLQDIHTSSVKERIQGFFDACRATDIQDPERLIQVGALGASRTRALARELLSTSAHPSAILASDSMIALEIFKVARELALRIPEDLSLITFHDADWTSVTAPPLTVIDQPVYKLGETVTKLLLERLGGLVSDPRRVILPTSIIERQSVYQREL
ncbi:LacI family transcriptional regulator [Neorhizobium lilium]|uniref:LacI family transcriptional regulator n=1 Tax=Neorhizobium lilium TaxID=2503024 RepID=A0A444LKX4_9HYPH|nr:LacI family DNA-binding transcriptional regulator [Neorhizobium lilium]RWX80965.1 LacI family transcriptional regulator [Neorhizobium lilium]